MTVEEAEVSPAEVEVALVEVEVPPVEEVELAVGGDVLDDVGSCPVEEVEVSPVEGVEPPMGGSIGIDSPVGGVVASSSCLQNPFAIDVADAMPSAWEVLQSGKLLYPSHWVGSVNVVPTSTNRHKKRIAVGKRIMDGDAGN